MEGFFYTYFAGFARELGILAINFILDCFYIGLAAIPNYYFVHKFKTKKVVFMYFANKILRKYVTSKLGDDIIPLTSLLGK